jgi:hypothetical protein
MQNTTLTLEINSQPVKRLCGSKWNNLEKNGKLLKGFHKKSPNKLLHQKQG